jgi:hypothetical protein
VDSSIARSPANHFQGLNVVDVEPSLLPGDDKKKDFGCGFLWRRVAKAVPAEAREDIMRRAFATSRVFNRLAVLAITVATISGTVSARTAYASEEPAQWP